MFILQKIEKILVLYFTTDEINEIKKLLSVTDDEHLLTRDQTDLLITYAEKKLSHIKHIQFLLLLGESIKNSGEYDAAVGIFNSLVETAGDEHKLANIKINCYLTIADIYEKRAFWKESLILVKKAKNAFKLQKDNKGIAYCENFLGTIYGEQGNIKKAKHHFEMSLSFLNPVKDKALVGILEINLGILNNILGNFDEAFTCFRRALVKFEQTHDINRIAELRHNIGMLYTQKGDYNSALTEFNKSIALSLDAGFKPKLGISYLSKSFIFTRLKDYRVASEFADMAMEICDKLNDRLSMADIYKIKGIIERSLNNYKLSENYLLTSVRLNRELSNALNKAETLYELGKLYVDMNQRNRALGVFKSSLEYYRKINSTAMVNKLMQAIFILKSY